MGNLSKDFSRYEFKCRHCNVYREPPQGFVDALQRLRDIVGRPLRLTSSYRCPVYNRQVGGIPNSEHLRANAADIPGTYATLGQVKRAGFGMIGVRGGRVIHVDMSVGKHNQVFDD